MVWFMLWATMFAPERLESKQEEEGHHKTEQTHGLGQGEAENGVREELLLERRVAGIADDQATENRANASTGAGHTDGGSAGTDKLGSRIDITANQRGVQSAGLLHAHLVVGGHRRGGSHRVHTAHCTNRIASDHLKKGKHETKKH